MICAYLMRYVGEMNQPWQEHDQIPHLLRDSSRSRTVAARQQFFNGEKKEYYGDMRSIEWGWIKGVPPRLFLSAITTPRTRRCSFCTTGFVLFGRHAPVVLIPIAPDLS